MKLVSKSYIATLDPQGDVKIGDEVTDALGSIGVERTLLKEEEKAGLPSIAQKIGQENKKNRLEAKRKIIDEGLTQTIVTITTLENEGN